MNTINTPDASIGEQCSMFRTVCSHKVIALGFNTLCYDAERRGIKPSARINAHIGTDIRFVAAFAFVSQLPLPFAVSVYVNILNNLPFALRIESKTLPSCNSSTFVSSPFGSVTQSIAGLPFPSIFHESRKSSEYNTKLPVPLTKIAAYSR